MLHHKIREWFGLEKVFKGNLVQASCHGQENFPLDQVAQSPIPLGLEHFPE